MHDYPAWRITLTPYFLLLFLKIFLCIYLLTLQKCRGVNWHHTSAISTPESLGHKGQRRWVGADWTSYVSNTLSTENDLFEVIKHAGPVWEITSIFFKSDFFFLLWLSQINIWKASSRISPFLLCRIAIFDEGSWFPSRSTAFVCGCLYYRYSKGSFCCKDNSSLAIF